MKIIILCLFLALAFMVVRLINSGRDTAAAKDTIAQSHHRARATATLLLLLVIVVAIEFLMWLHGRSPRGTLFVVHLCFAIPCALLLLGMRVHFNGQRYPNAHKYLAYSFLVSFVGMLPTGLILWHQI